VEAAPEIGEPGAARHQDEPPVPHRLDLAEALNLFNRVIVVEWLYDPMRRRRYLPRQVELRGKLRELAPDLAIDLSVAPDLRPLLQMSGAPVTVGFGPREFPWLSVGTETVTRDPVNGRAWVSHAAHILTLVESLGAVLNHESTVIRPRRSDRQHL
jgi:hypothetical protein